MGANQLVVLNVYDMVSATLAGILRPLGAGLGPRPLHFLPRVSASSLVRGVGEGSGRLFHSSLTSADGQCCPVRPRALAGARGGWSLGGAPCAARSPRRARHLGGRAASFGRSFRRGSDRPLVPPGLRAASSPSARSPSSAASPSRTPLSARVFRNSPALPSPESHRCRCVC